MALCRTPHHTILIFSLPKCELVHQIKLCELGSIEHPLEEDDLDQRFLMRNNTMMFMFHHPEFFDVDEEENLIHPSAVTRYGRLLFVDFTRFLLSQANKKSAAIQSYKKIKSDITSNNEKNISNGSLISMKMDPQFDCNNDYIEKISVISKDRMVCVLSSGKIILRDS